MPKLTIHFIAGGRYWRVGEDVSDSEIPENIREYLMKQNEYVDGLQSQRDCADLNEGEASPRGRKYLIKKVATEVKAKQLSFGSQEISGTHVRRKARWVKIVEASDLRVGETA